MSAPEIRIEGGSVVVRHAGRSMMEMTVVDFVNRVGASRTFGPACDILPAGVRGWRQSGDTVGLCIEVPPSARSVLWVTDDSPSPYGEGAIYERRYLSFPYVEILLVLHGGELTGQQQLYYRREPLNGDDSLLLPNLLNVSPNAYGQTAWLCLANLKRVGRKSWDERVAAVVQHTFSAKFNRSSEEHEGSSYWEIMREVDPRVSTVTAWHEATKKNPYFALEVPWKAAPRGLMAELEAMIESVHASRTPATAEELTGVLAAGAKQGERRGFGKIQEELF